MVQIIFVWEHVTHLQVCDLFTSGFGAAETAESNMAVNYFRLVRGITDERPVSQAEYVHMIRDCIKMQRNVCIFRHFNKLDKEAIFK